MRINRAEPALRYTTIGQVTNMYMKCSDVISMNNSVKLSKEIEKKGRKIMKKKRNTRTMIAKAILS